MSSDARANFGDLVGRDCWDDDGDECTVIAVSVDDSGTIFVYGMYKEDGIVGVDSLENWTFKNPKHSKWSR